MQGVRGSSPLSSTSVMSRDIVVGESPKHMGDLLDGHARRTEDARGAVAELVRVLVTDLGLFGQR